jgi:tetratricopeptide (TPR) repeat protein
MPFNPFPGLRPFEPDEDHLFFGREREIDELLRRLRTSRFLAVVGSSGSGKSSLVRSGLIPSLYSGFMVSAGSSWRVAIFRPGEDPVGHLAEALDRPDVLGTEDAEIANTNRVLLEATLRRSSLGLVEAVRLARIPPPDNLLVVVDQLEELFRFRRSRLIDNSRDEAIAFVKLLLEATRQTELPIYVVLTMRSDFIGDCMEYPGLPDAVNNGQYLVARMTRDEVRSAITGPVAVGGGSIAPRLVVRLLNELGDDQDQLPVLQHALMRTWDYWEHHHEPGEPIDMAAYDAIGTMREALSRHAEEAFAELGSEVNRQVGERLFKALTDTFSDARGVRRPTSVHELAGICETTEADVIRTVDVFRRPGRSFLMPPGNVPLESTSIVDLSHESLMRRWTRLVAWAEEERLSSSFYERVAQSASWFADGTGSLWRNPELELGLRWRRDNRPTAAWAARHNGSFDRVMAFLDESERERVRADAARERERKRQLRQAQWAAVVFGLLFVVAGVLAFVARRENLRATTNLRLAKEAVDQTLSSAGLDPASAGADVPQMESFRRELLEKAKTFYVGFLEQDADNEALRNEMGLAHLRLGHIDRWLENADEAAREYQQAIDQFGMLRQQSSAPEYRQQLANAYNWLGLTLTPVPDRGADAERAFGSALSLQEELVRSAPGYADYRQELARTRYNRGNLRGMSAAAGSAELVSAEEDFREAIKLLEPLAAPGANRVARLELGRVTNGLANLLAFNDRAAEARPLYEAAVQSDEALTNAEPDNREYKFELAKYCNNLSDLLRRIGEDELADKRSRQAIDLLDQLAMPAPSLVIEQADAENLRGQLLQRRDERAALAAYERAFRIFERLWTSRTPRYSAPLHKRYDDLLYQLVAFARMSREAQTHTLLVKALSAYIDFGVSSLQSGTPGDARAVVENISNLLPYLTDADRAAVNRSYEALKDAAAARR